MAKRNEIYDTRFAIVQAIQRCQDLQGRLQAEPVIAPPGFLRLWGETPQKSQYCNNSLSLQPTLEIVISLDSWYNCESSIIYFFAFRRKSAMQLALIMFSIVLIQFSNCQLEKLSNSSTDIVGWRWIALGIVSALTQYIVRPVICYGGWTRSAWKVVTYLWDTLYIHNILNTMKFLKFKIFVLILV